MRDGKFAKKKRRTFQTLSADFGGDWVSGGGGGGGGEAVQWGRWQGCHGSVPDGQAVSSQGVKGGGVGLSGSLAGRDTTPCDWGGARVSERGQERGDGGSGGVRWRPV